MKKVIAFLLAVICVLGAFALVSCANNKKKGNNGVSELEQDADYPLPDDLYFDGEIINFVTGEGANGAFSERSIMVEEPNGNEVDDKLYERNQYVQKKLGVEINLVNSLPFDDMLVVVVPALMAGVDDYDVIGSWMYGTDMTLDGVIYKIGDLAKEGADYIHPEADYWSPMYQNAIAYKGNVYWLTGDLSLRYTSGMFSMFVNKVLYSKYCEEKYGSIYDIVREGRWTNDIMQEMSALAYVDTNANERTDIADQLGFLSSGVAGILSFMVGNGLSYTKTYDDGTLELLLHEKNIELINSFEAAYTIYKDTPSNLYVTNDDDATSMQTFAQGTVLFVPSKLFTVEAYLREMADDYCIIPLPKYDDKQENYRTMIHDYANVYGLNWTLEGDHLRAVAATLELMAYQSHKTVMPAYYDSALKYKYTRDDDTAEMIDTIRDSVYLDFGLAWDMHLTGLWLRTNISLNAASVFKKRAGVWKTAFDKLISELEALESKQS